jgi:type I restriction enzyme S subunit
VSWPVVKLSDVAMVNPRLPKDADENQQVSFVAMASASDEGFLLSEESRVLKETKRGFTYFDAGDVLLAKITPCFENGKCLRPNKITNQIGFGSTEFHVLRSIPEKLDSTYLFYLVWSNRFRSLGEASMSGAAGQKRVSTDFLRDFEIPLPPLEEQKRIAAILDKADAIRRKRQQAIKLADDFLRSVFLEMFGDPVSNPKGWEVKSLQELANRVTKGESPKWQGFGYQDEGVRFVTSENVLWGTLDDRLKYISFEFHQKLKRSQLESNDLLINLVGASVGRACLVSVDSLPANINQAVAVISLDNSLIIPEIALLQILTESVQRVLLGNVVDAARANISLANIRELNILVPPIEKQQEILINLNKIKKTVAGQKCQNISMLFESLSQKAFSGNL